MHPYHTNDEPIGFLFQHTNRLFQELRRRLASLHGLEEAQPRIMGILAHDPGISQRELSERLAILQLRPRHKYKKWKFKA